MSGEEGGGRERAGDPSFHDDRTGFLRVETDVCVCVLVQGLHGGETPSEILFSFFPFPLGKKE